MLSPWPYDLRQLATRHGNRIAVTDPAGTATFVELLLRAESIAARLVQAGVGPGKRVVTLVRNSAEAVSASWGILLAGGCEVTLNPAQGEDELKWCTSYVQPSVFVHDGRSFWRPDAPVFCLDCSTGAGEDPIRTKFKQACDDDWGRILFTSGTTGRPKGVVYTHYGRWLACQLLRAGIARTTAGGGSTLLMTSFSHGSSLLAYALLANGDPVHFLDGADIEAAQALVRGGQVRHIFAPPTVLAKIVQCFGTGPVEGIRTIFTGTAPLSSGLLASAERIFGECVRITYGMTEIFNPIAVLEPIETHALYRTLKEDAVGCVGWPAPGVHISIRNDRAEEVPAGEPGEIHIAAKHMFAGYLLEHDQFQPAATYHATGDLGIMDPQKGLRILGRLNDTIKTGGHKVLPQEVEAALRARGAPDELVILGLPSEYWGEVIVCAYASRTDSWSEAVQQLAKPLARYKQPRLYVSLPTLWRNPIGKVDRKRIRQFIQETYELKDGPHPSLRRRGSRHHSANQHGSAQ